MILVDSEKMWGKLGVNISRSRCPTFHKLVENQSKVWCKVALVDYEMSGESKTVLSFGKYRGI